MRNVDLRQALTMREIVGTYGTAVHVATTLQPPPPPVRLHQGMARHRPLHRPSPLRRTAARFIAWFG
jgi:hypothetical protein